jgi:hypothetical protein
MSTAVFPLGMNSMPSSGYNHKSTFYNKQYSSWKGTGLNKFPVGTAPGHIRPLTNNDPGNTFQTGFGLPRPIKHYRKGRLIIDENDLTNRNINRFVKSSNPIPIGGSSSSSGLLNDMLGAPGSYSVKLNNLNTDELKECNKCESIGVVANYKPNLTNLLENPEPNTTNNVLCCNQEKFAKRRVIYASTNLNKNYYTTTKQYLQNRCKTYQQKAFNFLSYKTNNDGPYGNNNPYYYSVDGNIGGKPGGPLSLLNTYLANCQLNTQLYEGSELAFIYKMLAIMLNENIIEQSEFNEFEKSDINSIQGFFDWINELPEPQKSQALVVFKVFIKNPYWGMPPSGPTNPANCQLTVYKPSNYQYATQGAVSSSSRLLRLNVNTISTNAASIQNYNNTGEQLVTANQLTSGDSNNYSNLLKLKSPSCNTPYPLNFYQSGKYQNKKFCAFQRELPQYQIPNTQPSTYRYYPGTVFRSNHFSQSPNTYNTTSGSKSH